MRLVYSDLYRRSGKRGNREGEGEAEKTGRTTEKITAKQGEKHMDIKKKRK